MYSVYVVEEISTPNTNPTFTSTNTVEVNSYNTIQLNTGSYYDIKKEMYVSINNGQKYLITDVVSSTVNQTYTLTISGEITQGLFTNATWRIYDKTVTSNHIVLDTEDIDISTVFAVSDISDISSRKDSITKNITLKATDKNKQAFGHIFHLNRSADLKLSNKLFFNYTPIRTVDCLVYEDNMLILKGNLYVSNTDLVKGYFDVTITGKVAQLKTALGDKELTDLNLNDMEHPYSSLAILDSWGGFNMGTYFVGNSRTYWKNLNTNIAYTKPYQPGVGYIYPTIDYGEKFQSEDLNLNYDNYKLQNYRPGVWVREYFERIFKNSGYTYEIKGSPDFINKFNKIFVPNSSEGLFGVQRGIKGHLTNTSMNPAISPGPTPHGWNTLRYADSDENNLNDIYVNPIVWANNVQNNLIEIDSQRFPNATPFFGLTTPDNQRANNLIKIKKNFNSDARVEVSGTFKNQSPLNNGQKFLIQVVRRDRLSPGTEDTVNDFGLWEVLGEQTFTSTYNVTINFTADIYIPAKDYNVNQQLQVRILRKEANNAIQCIINSASIKFAKDANTNSTVELGVGDNIVPLAPENIKQYDFIKSIAGLFNLYIYNQKDNPKHIIFQTYNDYYGFATAQYIKTNSTDWTNKIDYSKGLKMKSNITIPKKYLFTMKDDSDYLNQTYKEKYGQAFGSLKFNDSYGFSDEKKVELIFSPTPSVQITGTDKLIPYLCGGGISLLDKKRAKTNIRLLYYNGVHACSGVNIGGDLLDGSTGVWHLDYTFSIDWYAQCSNYLFDESSDIHHTPFTNGKPSKLVPVSDLHYSYPKEFYFNVDSTFFGIQNSYDYYKAQTTELTNGNMFTVECQALLNEGDISNLDLRVPVFIDMGELGYCYFKVLNVEYRNNKEPSTVTLQKIIL